MQGIVAIALPAAGADRPSRFLRLLAGQPGPFQPLLLAPHPLPGLDHHRIAQSWLPRLRAGRHAAALRRLLPAVIEVHDDIALAVFLGGRFRPIPVILVAHTDPQRQRGAQTPAERTFLLAQATRVAALSAEIRARLLDGVHPAMRHCALLPPPEGPEGSAVTAAALDALRLDALKAWSRPLHGPI